MNKKLTISLIILVLISLTGCAQIKEEWNKKFSPEDEKNTTEEEEEFVCDVEPRDTEYEGLIYYFDSGVENGLKTFMRQSSEFLYCSLTRLDSEEFADILIERDEEIEVMILFDKDSTMDCSTACVPYSYSQYNNLYSEALELNLIDNNHQNFCVSEDGIFVMSKNLDSSDRKDFGLFIKSDDLREIYVKQFDKLWSLDG